MKKIEVYKNIELEDGDIRHFTYEGKEGIFIDRGEEDYYFMELHYDGKKWWQHHADQAWFLEKSDFEEADRMFLEDAGQRFGWEFRTKEELEIEKLKKEWRG